MLPRWILAGTLLAAAATLPLEAQTGSMTASADVSNVAISIASAQALQFGAVLPGTPQVIDPKTSLSAGRFEINGARRAEFTLSMTLPAQLTTGGGPHIMSIGFGPSGGCYRDKDQQPQCTYYDPATALVDRLRNNAFPNNTFYVWMGGTVSPALGQFPGVYSGIITASVAYTGN